MRRYNTYKDSGIELVGEVPADWEITLLVKVLSSIVDYRGRTPTKVDHDQGGMLLITARNIKNGAIDYSLSEEYVDVDDVQSLLGRGRPEIGDVLFTTEAPLGEVANVDRTDFALAQRIIKFRGKEGVLNNYFLKFWIMSSALQFCLNRNATGSTAVGLKGSKVRLLPIVLPHLSEQQAIADYLDAKTAQIDRKIDLLTQKAAKHRQLKQALINTAVTRGLDQSAPMKDSGVAWIGEVPTHWGFKRLKDAADLRYSNVDKLSQEGEVPVALCNYVDVYKNDFIDPSLPFMAATANATEIKRFSLRKHDVLVTKDSETADDIAVSALVLDTLPGVLCGYHLAQLRGKPGVMYGPYLFRLFQSDNYGHRFATHAKGIRDGKIIKSPKR